MEMHPDNWISQKNGVVLQKLSDRSLGIRTRSEVNAKLELIQLAGSRKRNEGLRRIKLCYEKENQAPV